MKELLNLCLVQTDTFWEDIESNLDRLSSKLLETDPSIDIIILPELFSTGFTMEVDPIAEPMDGKAVTWMKNMAKVKNCLLIGSVLIKEGELYYNRLIVAFPDGGLSFYDKRHLFSFAGEDKVFTSGNKRLIFEYKGFKICPLICYDLRFPVWSRNTDELDLLIYVANWPNARMLAWDTLLRARAIENLCYVAGVNRVGTDHNKLTYTGHSSVYDAMGEKQLDLEEGIEATTIVTIYRQHIEKTRDKFGFLNDKDNFKIL